MRGDLLVHHLALPVTDRCHVDLDTTRPRAVLGAMTHERCDFRALNLVLAGQAIDVGARPTNPSSLHHRRASSRSRHVPREELPACTTAENENFDIFRLHVDLLRVMRLFAVRRGGRALKTVRRFMLTNPLWLPETDAMGGEKVFHRGGDVDRVSFDGEVSRIEKLDRSVREISSKCFCARRDEEG